MPLSEQEQRMLKDLERQFLAQDADVVTTGDASKALSYRNMVLGALGVLFGLGAILAGIAIWNSVLPAGIALGVVGFAAMVAGVILAITPSKHGTLAPSRGEQAPSSAQHGGGDTASFMDKLNDRWERRQRGE